MVCARGEFGVDCLPRLLMRLDPRAFADGVAINKCNWHWLGPTGPCDDRFARLRGRCMDVQAEKGADQTECSGSYNHGKVSEQSFHPLRCHGFAERLYQQAILMLLVLETIHRHA